MGQIKFVGIDFSLTCPAVSILSDDATFQNSKHYYLTNTKKYIGEFDNIIGNEHRPYKSDMERYLNLATWVVYETGIQSEDKVFLEGYSMGSTGKIFNIAEATAILKYLLYHNNVQYIIVPPTSLKMFAGKGNASKDLMYDFFLNKTGEDLKKRLNATGKISNPITDIVDSFYLASFGKDYLNGNDRVW